MLKNLVKNEIIGNVTNQGTIYVRRFVNGKLINKRVWRNGEIQYDTLFNNGKPISIMITNLIDNTQIIRIPPQKVNIIQGLLNRLFMGKKANGLVVKKNGQSLTNIPDIDLNKLKLTIEANLYRQVQQGLHCFGEALPEYNNLFLKLKDQYLKSLFR